MKTARGAFLLGLLTFVFCAAGWAQQVTGELKGTVTDASGAAIPDAQVVATDQQTGISKTFASGNNGTFDFPQLPVGTYTVTVTKSGFETSKTENIVLNVGSVYSVPVTMQVGAVSQSVEVQGNAAEVETSSMQLNTVIEGKKIVDLPLNGRNWVQLQQLAPGVVATSDRFSGGNYATNGAQSQQNSFLINGTDAIDLPLNTPLIIPSPDAIAEFNLIDSSINPEYGRNSGGVLNAVIKSGTNEFHGDAFEFYRDTFLNGRNLFQATKPIYHQNQFGGTVGGPIWKNHTFFFLSYQGTRFRQPEPGTSNQTTVFSDDQRNGTFPALVATCNANPPANQPNPPICSATSPFPLTGESGTVYPAGTLYMTIFPTGHIPQSDYNPISQKLLAYVPAANTPGDLYSFNPIRSSNQNQGIARVDHTFSEKDSLWATVLFNDAPDTETLPFTGATLPGFGDSSQSKTKGYSADWVHSFNGSTLNELRASYVRFNFVTVEPITPTLPSSLGFQINPQDPAGAGIPLITLTGYFDLGFSNNGPQPRIDETYELADNFSLVHGKHTWKVGFDAKRYGVINPFLADNNGVYTFGGSGTYSTGDPAADFVLGIPDSFQQESGSLQVGRSYEYYAYVQDTWKATRSLTLNYGAGYQIDTPLNNLYFHGEALNCFRPGEQSTVFPTAPVGLVFPGDKGCSGSGYYSNYHHIGPRAGFAWSPGSDANKNFVIRGGFGIYFNRTEEELLLQNLGAPPFSLTSIGAASVPGYSPAFANPYQDIASGKTVPNPFPFTAATSGSNINFQQFYPMSLNVINPNFTAPYAMNFNFNVQKELPSAVLLQIAYVGSLGRHLELAYEGNPISPAGQAACAADPGCIADRFNQHVDYPSHAELAPGNIFASVGTQATVGVSSYNSLQVSANKRLTHGLTLLAAYTWAHSIDDTSSFENSSFNTRGTDPYNFAADRGDSAYDARQRLVLTYDYELPHLTRFWNNAFVRTTLDGWHIAGITTLQSGFPIPIGDTNFTSLTCDAFSFYACPDAPNAVGPVQTYDARNAVLVNGVKGGTKAKPYYYFNPNSFAIAPYGVIGNEGRNNFHGPGINNTDFVLSKRVYLTGAETTRFIELRLEAYNAFNHTQFQSVSASNGGTGVNGNIASSNFGRVTAASIGRTIQLGAKFYF